MHCVYLVPHITALAEFTSDDHSAGGAGCEKCEDGDITHFWEDFFKSIRRLNLSKLYVPSLVKWYYAAAKLHNPGGTYAAWLSTALNDVFEIGNTGLYLLEQPLLQYLVCVQLAKRGMTVTSIKKYTYGGSSFADGTEKRAIALDEPFVVSPLRNPNGSEATFMMTSKWTGRGSFPVVLTSSPTRQSRSSWRRRCDHDIICGVSVNHDTQLCARWLSASNYSC